MTSHPLYRILVVEDNPLQLQLAKDLFTLQRDAAGRFEVATAQSLADALDELEASSFDAVLLDLTLPDSRGLDTFRALRGAAVHTPIVVWSGHDDQVALTAMREGAQEYLPKGDVAPAQLIRTMSHLIERSRAERAALSDRQRMKAILDAAPDSVKVLDLEGRVVQVNPAGLALLEGDAGEIIGDLVLRYIDPPYRAQVKDLLSQVVAGENVEAEIRIITRKGNVRWVSTRAIPLRNPNDDVEAILAITRDVTDAKRIEEDLRHAREELLHIQKLEAVGRLAGGVAHDFNNLLTAISGHADLLLEHVDNREEAREEVEEIKHGVHRAAALTRQLLAFSRKQVMQPVVLDLHAVVTEMRRLLGRLIGENIELVTTASQDTATIRADRSQIEQVIMNLVVNSRDAMPLGGRVLVATDLIAVAPESPHPSGARPGVYARLTVSDTGTGMEQSVLDHIFEPFFTTKEVGSGTGLGLATVYGIVKQSGGYIEVSSNRAGTSFELLFPQVDEPAQRSALPIRSPDARLSGTILIVEDEKSVRDIASRILQRAGYDVIVASDGMDGLEVGTARIGEIDLVVTDVIMPRLNGPDLVKRLRALRSDIRVLFTSGYTDDAVFPHGTVSSGIGFLEKPFTPAALVDAARKAIGSHGQPI